MLCTTEIEGLQLLVPTKVPVFSNKDTKLDLFDDLEQDFFAIKPFGLYLLHGFTLFL